MDTLKTSPSLHLSPIGFISTSRAVKFDAPHQPDAATEERSVVTLLPGFGYERGLHDLVGFERIWLLWWFHRNTSWRPMVKPPRGNSRRRGVFATRSPHRPNPIGMTAVPLHTVSGLSLVVGSNDLVDGTPILDIKPYLPEADAFPDSRIGWLSEIDETSAASKRFDVSIDPLAAEQLQWLAEHWRIDFFARAKTILERDPTPHRTRRICSRGNDLFRMGCGAWRLYFSVNDLSVLVHRISPGYPPRLLAGDATFEVPYQEAQAQFASLWGNEPD